AGVVLRGLRHQRRHLRHAGRRRCARGHQSDAAERVERRALREHVARRLQRAERGHVASQQPRSVAAGRIARRLVRGVAVARRAATALRARATSAKGRAVSVRLVVPLLLLIAALPLPAHAQQASTSLYVRSDSDRTTVITPRLRVTAPVAEDTTVDVT